jgi:pilus biogenesis lipoprotein CpaD
MNPLSKSSFAVGIGLVIGLSGCDQATPPQPLSLQSAAPLTIPVEKQTQTHALYLGGNGQATPLERDRLHAFIADMAGRRPEALHVTISGAPTAVQLRSLTTLLIGDGVDPHKIAVAPSQSARSPLTITVDRYVATPPLCNPWGAANTASPDVNANPARAELGCSDLNNLGAMVADPHDLVKGSSYPYADGATAAAAVSRYESDAVKPFLSPGGFGPGAGGSSGGSGTSGSTGGQ